MGAFSLQFASRAQSHSRRTTFPLLFSSDLKMLKSLPSAQPPCSSEAHDSRWGLSASPSLFNRLCPQPNRVNTLPHYPGKSEDLLEPTASLESHHKACFCGTPKGTRVRDRSGHLLLASKEGRPGRPGELSQGPAAPAPSTAQQQPPQALRSPSREAKELGGNIGKPWSTVRED